MIVFGDSLHRGPVGMWVSAVREFAVQAQWDDLDDSRQLLVQSGQLEQGVFDAPAPAVFALRPVVQRLTDICAANFVRNWAKECGSSGLRLPEHSGTGYRTAALECFVHLESARQEAELTIKVPEGFEFYALFPEQYCLSALEWAAARRGLAETKVLVLGIRSIGTSLSALVRVVLEGAGWRAARVTVRPKGEPFHRQVQLERASLSGHRAALVVDEGPGLSGSSMAAAARALAAAGLTDISLFPGHRGEPGPAGGDEVLHWWKTLPVYCGDPGQLRWGGLSLAQSLARRALEHSDGELPAGTYRSRVEDLSAGAWRAHAFDSRVDWPAVCPLFERMKFRSWLDGERSTVWKFSGFGCLRDGGRTAAQSALDETNRRAAAGWGPRVIGQFRGFAGVRWVKGPRIRPEAGPAPGILAHIAQYVKESAGAPLSELELRAARTRRVHFLYWNTREALGDEAAERARLLAEQAPEPEHNARYGDGRLARWEWVQTASGQLLKLDSSGHDLDHTAVGTQPFLWDIAGASVEWELGEREQAPLLEPWVAEGINGAGESLRAFAAAYAAFRLGMMTFALGQADEEEKARLMQASAKYKAVLLSQLGFAYCGRWNEPKRS